MRNVTLSVIAIVVMVACLGYGASHLTRELSELQVQAGELKQAQAAFNVQVTRLEKRYGELEGRLSALSKPSGTEERVERELKNLNDRMAKLKDELSSLRSMSTPRKMENARSSITPEMLEERKKRCRFVEEYLTKVEQIYAIKDPEERTEKRIQVDQEYKHTRDFIIQTLGKTWMDSYEDALQAAYFIEDPVRNVAGRAKIKPLVAKVLQKCMDLE